MDFRFLISKNKVFLLIIVIFFIAIFIIICSHIYNKQSYSKIHKNQLLKARNLLEDEHSKNSFDLAVNIIDNCYDLGFNSIKIKSSQCFLQYNNQYKELAKKETNLNGMQKGDSVIIGGANKYSHEEISSNIVGEKGRVMIFEPDMFQASFAKEKFKKYGNMEIYPFGLWKTNTTMKLWRNGIPVESSVKKNWCAGISMKDRNDYTYAKFIKLDDFIKEHNVQKLDYIKLNIEGSELEALIGAKNTLKKFKPRLNIFVDHHPSQLYSIILYLDSLNLNYKFKFGQENSVYTYCLYASSDN